MEDKNEDLFDIFKMFQKAKDMSNLINPNDATENPQNKPESMDLEKMMKNIEVLKFFNSYMNKNRNKPFSFENNTITLTPKKPMNTPALNAIKAALPYLEFKYRKNLAIFIKMIELQNLLESYNRTVVSMKESSGEKWNQGVLLSMRPHVDSDKQELIDRFLNFLEMKTFLAMLKNIEY